MKRLLTRTDICELLSISTTTLDRWIREGRLPRPTHRLGKRSPRWSHESLQSAIEDAFLD